MMGNIESTGPLEMAVSMFYFAPDIPMHQKLFSITLLTKSQQHHEPITHAPQEHPKSWLHYYQLLKISSILRMTTPKRVNPLSAGRRKVRIRQPGHPSPVIMIHHDHPQQDKAREEKVRGRWHLFLASEPTRDSPLSFSSLLFNRAISLIDRLPRTPAELVKLVLAVLCGFGNTLVQLELGAGVVDLSIVSNQCPGHCKIQRSP